MGRDSLGKLRVARYRHTIVGQINKRPGAWQQFRKLPTRVSLFVPKQSHHFQQTLLVVKFGLYFSSNHLLNSVQPIIEYLLFPGTKIFFIFFFVSRQAK